MPRGGARPGAGRKGTKTKEHKAFAARVSAEGVTPLECMAGLYRHLYTEATSGPTVNVGKWMQAAVIAEKVAPYMHPRLAPAPPATEERKAVPDFVVTVNDGSGKTEERPLNDKPLDTSESRLPVQ
jgi:hypothetical protein